MNKKYDLEVGIDPHNNFLQVAVVDKEGKTSCLPYLPAGRRLVDMKIL